MACCSSTCFSDESKLNCVQYLLQYGADVNATDKYRMTALMYAVQTLNHTVVDFLLTVPGLMINLQDKEGSSVGKVINVYSSLWFLNINFLSFVLGSVLCSHK